MHANCQLSRLQALGAKNGKLKLLPASFMLELDAMPGAAQIVVAVAAAAAS